MQAAVSLENIFIGFNGVPVLRNVNLTLQENTVHAIAGNNGAGKSTLMKILTGVYQPDAGKVTVLGKEVGSKELGAKKIGIPKVRFKAQTSTHRQEVAMVYQDLSLIPSLTVTQNIFLHGHPFRRYGLLDDSRAREEALEIFALMDCSGGISPDSPVAQLSVGQAQLVEIAKALAGKPQIIVFDEPTAALSDIETAQLFNTISILKDRGLSIIYITHYLKDVMHICDYVTVLRDGQAVFSAATRQTSIAEIVQHMLGPEAKLQRLQRDKVLPAVSPAKVPLLELETASSAFVGPLTLRAYPGEIIGLAGLLGSGRSEILRLLYGLDPLLGGQLKIDGQKITIRCPNQALKHGIFLVPEERRSQGLVLDFSVMHNLSLGILSKLLRGFLLQSKQEANFARQSLANLKIKARNIYQPVRFLSGGNQQKVVFGKCLLREPRILLLDDPTFGVDVLAKNEIMGFIQNFAAKGNIVLFVSSELGEIANFCDRIYIVKKQNIAAEVESVTEEQLLQKVQ